MKRSFQLVLLLLTLAWASCSGNGLGIAPKKKTQVPQQQADSVCPLVRIEPQRLPDMNIPRGGHATFCLGQEILVVGGHTTGFIPTATAERFDGSEWQTIPTTYEHDNPLALRLSSGQVLVAGGHEKHLGIGQTFPVEMYEPETHSFRGFGCLDHKRAIANGVEIDSGRVVIAGNWYGGDSIEIFDGRKFFSPVKDVSVQRAAPFMIRSAADNVLILSGVGTRDDTIRSTMVDRLKGEAFSVPLLETWHPLRHLQVGFSGADYFIGDETRDFYASLMPVEDSIGHVALAYVQDTIFSLLPTACPVPTDGPWGRIIYGMPLIADRSTRTAYMAAYSQDQRLYVLAVDYGRALDGGSARLTLYYTDPQPQMGFAPLILTADGSLLMAGGSYDDNFAPYSSVWLLRMNGETPAAQTAFPAWLWLLLGLLAIVCIAQWPLAAGLSAYLLRRRQNAHSSEPSQDPLPSEESHPSLDSHSSQDSHSSHPSHSPEDPPGEQPSEELPLPQPLQPETELSSTVDASSEQLTAQLRKLMESEKMYLSSELRLNDVAARLGTSSRNISDCIRRSQGCSFSQFVNGYRVEHAKKLMQQRPDIKMTNLFYESGFANETSFYRTFKLLTGMTPKEWIQKND